MDYDPNLIDSFEKLKEKFCSFGNLLLEAADEERFFVAYKLFAKNFPDEEALFDELCSQALNGNRVIDMKLLEKIESEAKPAVMTTPTSSNKRPQLVNTEKRKVLNNMSNFTPPRTPQLQPIKKMQKPDSPITLDSTQHTGSHFNETKTSNEFRAANLIVHELPADFFFYGRRFDPEESTPIPIDEQIAAQLSATDDPEKKLMVSGRLLVKTTENGDELVVLRSGPSSIQLDISALDSFSYFHGMMAEFVCLPVSSSSLKAIKCIKPKPLNLAPLRGTQEFLLVITAHGPFVDSNGINSLEVLAKKAIENHAHALILSGPFYDPSDSKNFTATSKQAFAKLCSILHNSDIKVIIVPNAAQDSLVMRVFPTPAQTAFDFGLLDDAENVSFLTDPCVFELNGVRFVVTNSQPMALLSKMEKYQGASQSSDRVSRLLNHLLSQRSVFPFQESNDLGRSGVLHKTLPAHLTERPHFMILPNVLNPTIKFIQNTVFINPRFCNKSMLKYATIAVNLRDARQSDGELNIGDYSKIVIHTESL